MLWKHCAFWLHCPVVTSLFPGSDKGGSDHSGIGWGSGPHQEVRCVHNITTCSNTDYLWLAYAWLTHQSWAASLSESLRMHGCSLACHTRHKVTITMVTASQAHPAKMAALYMTSSASGFTALLHNYSSEQLEVTWSIPSCLSGRHIPC